MSGSYYSSSVADLAQQDIDQLIDERKLVADHNQDGEHVGWAAPAYLDRLQADGTIVKRGRS